MLEVDELTKYYGNYCAVDGISFTVNKGEILGFLGPNGAGKSTTMKIITGYLSPTGGTVRIDGLDIVDQSLEARKRMGYLPEHPPLYLDMTVKEYLTFTARIRGISWKQVASKVDTVVDKCGLQKYYTAPCHSLSKGYRQRVGIAQAMIHEPMLLILDEPTIGLDPIQITEIRNLIKGFGGEHTVILSTHILPEVEMTCNRVVIISDGTLVAQDSTEHLRRISEGSARFSITVGGESARFGDLLSGNESISTVERRDVDDRTSRFAIETVNGSDLRAEVAHLAMENGLDVHELKSETPSLEEIFIKATLKE